MMITPYGSEGVGWGEALALNPNIGLGLLGLMKPTPTCCCEF